MITAAHILWFCEDPEPARAFFRDVMELRGVDAGDGWLIFALPPAEVAFHPGAGWGRGEGQQALFFMCDDIEQTVEELGRKGVEFKAPIAEEDWGRVTRLEVPGAGEVGLYQPTHPSPLDL